MAEHGSELHPDRGRVYQPTERTKADAVADGISDDRARASIVFGGLELVRVVKCLEGPFRLEGLVGVGSEIVISFRLFPYLPLRSQWTARIIELAARGLGISLQKEAYPSCSPQESGVR